MVSSRCLFLALFPIAICSLEDAPAQDNAKAKAPATAQECLDKYFLNCDSLTENACELVSGSITKTNGNQVLARDFVWFRAQKMETKKKSLSYVEGRSFSPRVGPTGEFLERKLIIGDEGFHGLGSDPPMSPLDLTSRLPEGDLEAYLEKKARLALSQYEFPEICPAAVMAAVNLNPKEGTLGQAHALFARLKLIDEYFKEPLLVGTWRVDGKQAPGTCCVRVMFHKRQGYMPTFAEWRLRDTESKSDPKDTSSYTVVFNSTEAKWAKVPKKGPDVWAPIRIVNKQINKTSGQEWVIDATWRVDALQDLFFDVAKMNADRDGNYIAKIRRHMQSAKEKDKPDAPKDGAPSDPKIEKK